jgi:hypothetical protein
MMQPASRIRKLIPAVLLMLAIPLFQLPFEKAYGQQKKENCQCTDYVYRQRDDISRGMGHAKDWIHSAHSRGLPISEVPRTGDVVVIINGEHGFNAEFGHVAMVIGVNRDHTRFDIAGWDGIKNNCNVEIYTNLTVTGNTAFIQRSMPFYQ